MMRGSSFSIACLVFRQSIGAELSRIRFRAETPDSFIIRADTYDWNGSSMTLALNFRSDNESPAHSRIVEAVVEANSGPAFAYATDSWSDRLDSAFSEFFETPVVVLPLSTGTIANSIALASVPPPWGIVYCHASAHILNEERRI